MKIASIQLDICWQDKQKNLLSAERFIKQAKDDACDLVVFPEMFNTGFSMDTVKIAENSDAKTFLTLSLLAKKYQINLIAGYAEAVNSSTQNVGLSFNRDGELLARYVKNYPFSFAGEDKFYQAGNEQVIFDLDGISCSLFICYDLRFPELFRKVAKNIEVVFVIANWPASRHLHWQALLQARAIENQCFVVGVNRIGKDGEGIVYDGGSCVFDPSGQLVSLANKQQEYLATTIHASMVASYRKQYPFLLDIKS